MGKIDLFPGESFPIGSGLSARQSRNGTIISTDSAKQKKKRKAPTVAPELAVVKLCLKDARQAWRTMNPQQKAELISVMRPFVEVRFPGKTGKTSDFNLFYSLYSGIYYGNYYFNGALSMDTGNELLEIPYKDYQPIFPQAPRPPYITFEWFYHTRQAWELTFSDVVLDVSNNQIKFKVSFPPPEPWMSDPEYFQINFSSDRNNLGFFFYVSTPSVLSDAPFAMPGRLLVACFKPSEYVDNTALFQRVSSYSFFGPLAKYVDFSTLELTPGSFAEVTMFAMSAYGQASKIGTFKTEIV